MSANREPPGTRTSNEAAPASAAFDRWLKRGLDKLYGPVLTEPISQELLDIIETDRARSERDPE